MSDILSGSMSGNGHHEKITYIGKVDYRNKELTFGIKERDRTRHTYVIGKTGMGKSTLLENLAIQDIINGEGLCVIDPHGSMAEKLLDHIPESRIKDVIYFAPFDAEYPLGLNVLEKVDEEKRHLVASGVMAAFKKIWVDAWSARMEYILTNIMLALLENEGQSLLGVNRMLTDKDYRKFIVSNVTDPTVKDFWEKEYASYTERFAQEAAPAIQNKVGQFVGNPVIRNIVGQSRTSFNLREIMDQKKILIVNLSKGKVGETNANLIGSLLITKIYLAAMSRADAGPYELEKLPPFYLYVDEFQNFANESFASILSEARKYNLALTVAHQYIEQMTDEVKAAVFGNVGTMITFRVGATDAEVFEKEFAPYFTLDDIVNLSAYQIYLRLMIDGQGSKPFSAKTLEQIPKPPHSYAQAVISSSRLAYGRQKFVIEDEIMQFYKPAPKVEKKKDIVEGVKSLDVATGTRETVVRTDVRVEKKEPKKEERNREEPRPAKEQQYQKQERQEKYEEKRRIPKKEDAPSAKVSDFDNRPAKSLKEALEEAMRAHKEESLQPVEPEEVPTEEDRTRSDDTTRVNASSTVSTARKEIDETTLRKLLDD
jgi:hypothetical protein